MSELVERHDQHEVLRAVGDRFGPTRYGEVVNRYIGAVGYRPGEAERRPLASEPTVRTDGLIVVGVDDKPASYTAVDHAAIEAELRGWELRIVHVLRSGDRRGRGAKRAAG